MNARQLADRAYELSRTEKLLERAMSEMGSSSSNGRAIGFRDMAGAFDIPITEAEVWAVLNRLQSEVDAEKKELGVE